MAIRYNAFFSFDGVTVSADVLSLDGPSDDVAALEATTMGSNTRKSEAGLKTWGFSGTIQGDADGEGASEVAFHSVYNTKASTAAVVYRNDSAAVGATNAEWSGTGVLTQFDFAGASGDKLLWTFSIEPGSTLARAVA